MILLKRSDVLHPNLGYTIDMSQPLEPSTSDLIHDLKNHLQALYGHTYMLKSQLKSNASALDIIEKMNGRFEKIEKILNQLPR